MDFYTSVTRLGDVLHVRGYENGKRAYFREKFEPILFTLCHEKDGVYKTLNNQHVKPIQFDSMTKASDRIKQELDLGNKTLFGFETFPSAFIAEYWPNDITFDKKLIRIGWIDIEVQSNKGFPYPHLAKRKITSITIKVNGEVHVWGLMPYENNRKDVFYHEFTRETAMLEDFIERWQDFDIDILSGWNIDTFDVPYIVNRIANLFDFKTACKLSPLGWVREKRIMDSYGNEHQGYDICGITAIDYLPLYKKYKQKGQESYTLGHIGHVELGEGKVDYSEYADLFTLYLKDHQKFIDYNIRDVELCERLDAKMGYMDVVLALAYNSHVNFEGAVKQTQMWDAMVNRHLISKGIVMPLKPRTPHREKLEGAYVKPPQCRLHRWIVGFDATSLYPSAQLMFNISPDTLVTNDHQEFRIEDVLEGRVTNDTNYILAGNGHYFVKDRRGFMPEIIDGLFQRRQFHKKRMLEAEVKYNTTHDVKYEWEEQYHNSMQATQKVGLNSCYGTMGSPFFRFYDVRLASAITLSGQLAIQWARDKINAYMNKVLKNKEPKDYVIAMDTDSLYISFEEMISVFCPDSTDDEILDFIEDITHKETGRITKVLKDGFEELRKILNAPKNYLDMKRESISNVGFWTAKKRYVLNMMVDESGRLPEPKIKIVGLEAVRSTLPQMARDALKKGIKIILFGTQEEAWAYIEEMRTQFDTLPIEEIGTPKGVSEIKKFETDQGLISGTPIQVRAAHLYNVAIHKHGLNTKYSEIREGDKMKYVYLTEPNPLRQDVFGYLHSFPHETGLGTFVDRDKQFTSMFLKPFSTMLKVRGWEAQRRAKIGKFYASGIKRAKASTG